MTKHKITIIWILFSLALIGGGVLTLLNNAGYHLNTYYPTMLAATISAYLIYTHRQSIPIGVGLIGATCLFSPDPFLTGLVFTFAAIIALLNKKEAQSKEHKKDKTNMFWLAVMVLAIAGLFLNDPASQGVVPHQLYDNFTVTMTTLQLFFSYKVIVLYQNKIKPFFIAFALFLMSQWVLLFTIIVALNLSINN